MTAVIEALGAWTFGTVVGITYPSDGPDVATLPQCLRAEWGPSRSN